MRNKNRSFSFYILSFLFCLNVLAWIAVFDSGKSGFLEVVFFNVGQGDAIFIETPKKHQILIDGGPSSMILEKLAEEMPFWDRSLDLIILTHPEHDHIAGLIEVLKRYEVENILWTGVQRKTAEYDEWQDLIQKEGARIIIAEAGQRIILPTGSHQDFLRFGRPKAGFNGYIDILHPFLSLGGQEIKNVNNTSIVCRLSFGEDSFLFTGDAFKSVENHLVENGIYLNSDVLKVGHHGSKTSSSEEFIKVVAPRIAVISVEGKTGEGKDCDSKKRNKYGHPNCEVLEILKKFGIEILRTDLNGDIKIISDGNNLELKD